VKPVALMAALGFALAAAAPAGAALSEADLSGVSLRPAKDASVPAAIRFLDDDGRSVALGDLMRDRATLLILADYRCHTICGPILAATEATILGAGLGAGRDFNLIVIGIDPTETRADASAMKAAQFGDPALAASAHFLSGDAAAITALSAAIGYHARYDADARRYAHPTDLLVLTPDRHVSRLLPGLAVSSEELRFALVEAGAGYLGSLVDRVHVLCYGLDPAHGVYNAAVQTALAGSAGATLAAIGAMAAIAHRRRKRMNAGGVR
jgi:protein SCO1/2